MPESQTEQTADLLEKDTETTGVDFQIFAPIEKADAATHTVWGWGAREEVDQSNEIMDYASSRPEFLAWSGGAQKRSGGKSLGNVRSMHNKVAAGRLIDFQANDVQKGFYMGAEIVDPTEWDKVEKGVYTGFSVGGKYLRRWPDSQNPGAIRYTARPVEMSIVDSPDIRSAVFDMVKAEGITKVSFQPATGANCLEIEPMEKAIPSSPQGTPNTIPGTTAQELVPPDQEARPAAYEKHPDPMLATPVSPTAPPSGTALEGKGGTAISLEGDAGKWLGEFKAQVEKTITETIQTTIAQAVERFYEKTAQPSTRPVKVVRRKIKVLKENPDA